ncbi:MAG: hypothetical protein RLP09_01565 [Sandaracinaceae bacterium]
MTTASFSAVDATLGYLYHLGALLWALRRQKTEPDFSGQHRDPR